MTKIFKLKDVLYHGTVVSNRFRCTSIHKDRRRIKYIKSN